MDHSEHLGLQRAHGVEVLASAARLFAVAEPGPGLLGDLVQLIRAHAGADRAVLVDATDGVPGRAARLSAERDTLAFETVDEHTSSTPENAAVREAVLAGNWWRGRARRGRRSCAQLCVPLRHAGRVVGALMLERDGARMDVDETVVDAMAAHIATALVAALHPADAPPVHAGTISERFLTEVIDAVPHPLYVKDAQHRWVLVNQALCQWLGRSREEVLGRSDRDFLPPEFAAGIVAEDDAALDTDAPVIAEVHYEAENFQTVSWLKCKRAFAMPDGSRYVVGINTDLSAREEARRALARSERFLTELIDAIPQILVVKDDRGRWVMVNRATAAWYGRSREALVGLTDEDLHPPDVASRYVREDLVATEAGQPMVIEESRRDAHGATRWFLKTKYGFTLPDGSAYRLAISADITEGKQAQFAVERQRHFLEALIDAVPEPLYVKDDRRRYILANDAFCRLLQASRDGLLGRTDEEVGPAARARINRDEDEGLLRTGSAVSTEERIGRNADTERWVLRNKALLADATGARYIVCVKTDITAIKRAERAARRLSTELEQSRAYLDAVINAIPYPVFVKNEQFRWTLVNEAFSKLVDIPVEELVGSSDQVLHGAKYASARMAEDREVFALNPGQSKVFTGTLEYRGRSLWFLRSKTLVALPDGRREIVGIETDITELKATELALRESEARFRGTFEQAAVGICHASLDGRLLRINERFCDILGFGMEEMLARSFVEITHPDDDANIASVAMLLDGTFDTYSMEKRYTRKDGEVVWGNLTVSVARTADGRPDYFIGVMEEITRRKIDEARLVRSEATLASAQRLAHVGSWHWNVESGAIEWSDETYRILDQDPDSFEPSYERFLTLVHPADVARVEDTVERAMRTGNEVRYELRVVRPTGEVRNLFATVQAGHDRSGRIRELLGSVQDITERKRSEELLRRSEATLAAAQRMAHLGSWRWDVARDLSVWSEETFRIFGVDPILFPVSMDGLLAHVHVDDRERVSALIRNAPESRAMSEYEFRVVRPSGEERLVHAVHDVIENDDGSVGEVVGSVHDITSRRLAEERIQGALQEKEILLKEIYHRVKNNLQVISSLLQMQARTLDDEQFTAAIEDSVRRVKSMALVHERLYRSRDLARVDFGDYMHTLVEQLSHSYHAQARGIRVVADVLEAPMGIETAIPCGLIVNELVSNAFKHAFSGRDEGTIMIRFSAGPGTGSWVLKVGDDGIGMPGAPEDARSLGLRLIRTLTEQISGTLDIVSGADTGTVFTITFLDEGKSK
ncbi:MAG: PAS domain S-box protein [Betaproteobacteria bacterium]|nr:PAS domain S-box protein [Betaproteobacteria bacterium]